MDRASSLLTCFHCGLAFDPGQSVRAEVGGQPRDFCCRACHSVAATIVANGLDTFYRFNQPNEQAAPAPADSSEHWQFLDRDSFHQQYVTRNGNNSRVELLIGGIHCAACVWLLEKFLGQMDGVADVTVSLSDQRAVIYWHLPTLPLSQIARAIQSIGYSPQPASTDRLADMQRRESRQALTRIGVAGIAMMQVGMFAIAMYAAGTDGMSPPHRKLMAFTSLVVSLPVVFYAALPFFSGALRGIRLRAPGMDVPVALAIALAFAASVWATVSGRGEVYFDSVAMFTFLLLSARYVEMRARHRSLRFRTDLDSLLPASALRLSDATEDANRVAETVPLLDLRVGDRIVLKPGQLVPADARIVDGVVQVDEAQLTGEFLPRSVSVGDGLVAGTHVVAGSAVAQVEAVGGDLQIQAVNKLLADAQLSKPQIAQKVDSLAVAFVIGVLIAAVVSLGGWWIYDSSRALAVMLSVLVVSCPCALSLATPAAITAATNALRQRGLLVADAQVWEKLSSVTDVVFDKTGTLTEGRLRIARCIPIEGGEDNARRIAAALEAGSEHPVAAAFTANVENTALAGDLQLIAGQGVMGCVDGVHYRLGQPAFALAGQAVNAPGDSVDRVALGQWILLAANDRPLCWFLLDDTLRSDAAALVVFLRDSGFHLHVLSGDSSGAAGQLARQLGIEQFAAGCSSAQKLTYIKSLQWQGAKVLALGDGVNDIPVLAAADVSMAMVNASGVAKSQADVIALSGRLMAVRDLLTLSERARRVIRQNLLWALTYNLAALPLAMAGLIAPYAAALGMSLSSVIVIANALRLQWPWKEMNDRG